MNVFVLSTGRCGSTTFGRACGHIRNYTSAHESRWGRIGAERLSYPQDHIEVDNRLAWFLGRLEAAYGDDAWYVHLTRAERATAESFVRRFDAGIIRAYHGDGILGGRPNDHPPLDVALDYCHTVNSNIRAFLKGKPRTLEVCLETAGVDFPMFWDAIGAKGDLQEALAEFLIRYNSSADLERPPESSVGRASRAVAVRIFRRLFGFRGRGSAGGR